jgi:hypothetical protein
MLTNFGTPQVICSDIVFRPILNGRVTPESLPPTQTVVAVADPPPLETVSLLTWGTVTTGVFREAALRQPYEFLYRELQTFLFTEPLKYQVIKNSSSDIVSVQLPLEANHPIEEIFWVVRRRAVADNNEWYNFGSRLERDIIWSAASLPDISGAGLVAQKPLLVTARLQANGQTLVEADERYFRLEAGSKHRGGYVPYNRFIYGYSFARQPGEHQPSGTANASRLNSLRLTLDVATPTVFGAPAAHSSQDTTWEVRVYVLALNWLRVQNGLVSRVYTD